MTQRTEARFKVFNRSTSEIFFRALPYNVISFNVGGSYDTSTHTYTVENAGVYLMGQSHNKKASGAPGPGSNPFEGRAFLRLTRNGIVSNLTREELRVFSTTNTTISFVTMYKFEVGDTLQIVGSQGRPRMNINSYSGNNTLNSWWGIKLNY